MNALAPYIYEKTISFLNDLTVTTQGSPAVGDTAMVKGTVRTDKDLGMGYVFSVIIEAATIIKQ